MADLKLQSMPGAIFRQSRQSSPRLLPTAAPGPALYRVKSRPPELSHKKFLWPRFPRGARFRIRLGDVRTQPEIAGRALPIADSRLAPRRSKVIQLRERTTKDRLALNLSDETKSWSFPLPIFLGQTRCTGNSKARRLSSRAKVRGEKSIMLGKARDHRIQPAPRKPRFDCVSPRLGRIKTKSSCGGAVFLESRSRKFDLTLAQLDKLVQEPAGNFPETKGELEFGPSRLHSTTQDAYKTCRHCSQQYVERNKVEIKADKSQE